MGGLRNPLPVEQPQMQAERFARLEQQIRTLETLTNNSISQAFETKGNSGGVIEGSEHLVNTPPNTLVSWRARIHGTPSGGTEGGVTVSIQRNGSTVKSHTFRIAENTQFGTSVEVIEFVQPEAIAATWRVAISNYGSGFSAVVDNGMLVFQLSL